MSEEELYRLLELLMSGVLRLAALGVVAWGLWLFLGPVC